MRKVDITQYSKDNNIKVKKRKKTSTLASIIKNFLRSILVIFCISSVLIVSVLMVVITATADIDGNISLENIEYITQSKLYCLNDEGKYEEYCDIKSPISRKWTNFEDIPKYMKDAAIAIEDKRFEEHHGVDIRRTGGAILTLFGLTKDDQYGGSTITQQLIKNITGKRDTTINRKLGEIVNAYILDGKYSKDQILEAYLNIVYYGHNCEGVGAASETYFGKPVMELSLAQCACIVGITQNPSKFDPYSHPEENKKRLGYVLGEMLEQNKISREEYDKAIEESKHMVFTSKSSSKKDDDKKFDVYNWYMDRAIQDVALDLAAKENMQFTTALEAIKKGGYKIYTAIDKKAQEVAESIIRENSKGIISSDKRLQAAFVMMDYKGRVLATVGRTGAKESDFLFDFTVSNNLQPGSSIKPLAVYAPALEEKLINYSSIVLDRPLVVDGRSWPTNSYAGYYGNMSLYRALAISSNAAAAQTLEQLGLDKSYDFITNRLGFTGLDEDMNKTRSALATGSGGKSVRNMVAAYQIFGNNGQYCAPYTYYYVENSKGEVILDNRDKQANYAISPGNATIMRHLLEAPVKSGTATSVQIAGWDLFGKTGTSNDSNDIWFIGGSPYAIAGVWSGWADGQLNANRNDAYSRTIWKTVMVEYLKDKEKIGFTDDPSVQKKYYNSSTGKLASSGNIGYFLENNLPS